MPDLIAVLVGVVSLILGWGLTTIAGAWTWRRQQILDAYIDLLEALDRSSVPMGQLWTSGRDIDKRNDEWIALADQVRLHLVEIDRAQGKLALVAGRRGADVAFELYFACDREFRRAIAVPPSTPDHYREASLQTAKAYFDVVDQGAGRCGSATGVIFVLVANLSLTNIPAALLNSTAQIRTPSSRLSRHRTRG